VQLGKTLLQTYPESSLLLTWGNEAEREMAIAIAAAMGGGARLVDRHSLKGLTAILKKVDLVVGCVSGPVHLAATVGMPSEYHGGGVNDGDRLTFPLWNEVPLRGRKWRV
jgi:heptosyltransferase-1